MSIEALENILPISLSKRTWSKESTTKSLLKIYGFDWFAGNSRFFRNSDIDRSEGNFFRSKTIVVNHFRNNPYLSSYIWHRYQLFLACSRPIFDAYWLVKRSVYFFWCIRFKYFKGKLHLEAVYDHETLACDSLNLQ